MEAKFLDQDMLKVPLKKHKSSWTPIHCACGTEGTESTALQYLIEAGLVDKELLSVPAVSSFSVRITAGRYSIRFLITETSNASN